MTPKLLNPSSEVVSVLETSPITVGGFRLRSRSAIPVGRPTLDGLRACLAFAVSTHDAAPYWIGDLLAYAKERGDWAETLDQVISETGITLEVAYQYHHLSKHVAEPARRVATSPSHARKVTSLEPKEQVEVLSKAARDGWSVSELTAQVKRMKRRTVIEGQAALVGLYRVVLAAPKWSDPAALAKLPVAAHTHDHATLFLRATQGALPHAYDVMRAWSFEPSGSGLVWDRVERNGGSHVQTRHEHILIGTRGKSMPDRPVELPDSVYVERQSWDDPSTPRGILRLIEKLYDGPRLQLFANEQVDGWDSLGHDPSRWHEEVERGAAAEAR